MSKLLKNADDIKEKELEKLKEEQVKLKELFNIDLLEQAKEKILNKISFDFINSDDYAFYKNEMQRKAQLQKIQEEDIELLSLEQELLKRKQDVIEYDNNISLLKIEIDWLKRIYNINMAEISKDVS
jgi:hypothetical protein